MAFICSKTLDQCVLRTPGISLRLSWAVDIKTEVSLVVLPC